MVARFARVFDEQEQKCGLARGKFMKIKSDSWGLLLTLSLYDNLAIRVCIPTFLNISNLLN